jgi:Skp family chaperone for outer membrane proteins
MIPKGAPVNGKRMGFEQTQKEKVIASLMAAYRQGQIAEIRLRLQAKPDEAEKVRQENARVSAEVDTLIGQMMDEWRGNVERAVKGLEKINTKLEAAVAEIKKQINVARNVVKIVGLLDAAASIAKKAAAGV